MKIFKNLALVGALTVAAHAGVVTESARVFAMPTTINDLQDPPAVFTQAIEDSIILFITRVEVSLKLVGVSEGLGFASEMFVSLNKDLGATSVLLNQVGTSENDPLGAMYDGWDVTFRDGAANGDVHETFLSSGLLQGMWEPDGRADATSSTRSQMLNVFNGSTGNGVWRLAVGDLAIGGQMRLESWSITLTGETGEPQPVPEPATLLGGCALAALLLIKRRRK